MKFCCPAFTLTFVQIIKEMHLWRARKCNWFKFNICIPSHSCNHGRSALFLLLLFSSMHRHKKKLYIMLLCDFYRSRMNCHNVSTDVYFFLFTTLLHSFVSDMPFFNFILFYIFYTHPHNAFFLYLSIWSRSWVLAIQCQAPNEWLAKMENTKCSRVIH
jgi:hypothetical protein